MRGRGFREGLDRQRAPLLLLAQLVLALLLLAAGEGRLLTPPDPVWTAIQERGRWRVGLDPSFPPFEMLDEEQKVVGYDVDLARAIAAHWGVELELVPLGYDGLLDALAVGRIDSVVSALPYDRRLTEDVLYSEPYFEAGVRIAVSPQSSIERVADLERRQVGVEWGSVGDAVARRLQRDEVDFERKVFETTADVIAALRSKAIDAALIDGVSLRLAQSGSPIQTAGPVLEGDAYVIALPASAPFLATEIDRSLKAIRDEGRLEQIEDRWFGRRVIEHGDARNG